MLDVNLSEVTSARVVPKNLGYLGSGTDVPVSQLAQVIKATHESDKLTLGYKQKSDIAASKEVIFFSVYDPRNQVFAYKVVNREPLSNWAPEFSVELTKYGTLCVRLYDRTLATNGLMAKAREVIVPVISGGLLRVVQYVFEINHSTGTFEMWANGDKVTLPTPAIDGSDLITLPLSKVAIAKPYGLARIVSDTAIPYQIGQISTDAPVAIESFGSVILATGQWTPSIIPDGSIAGLHTYIDTRLTMANNTSPIYESLTGSLLPRYKNKSNNDFIALCNPVQTNARPSVPGQALSIVADTAVASPTWATESSPLENRQNATLVYDNPPKGVEFVRYSYTDGGEIVLNHTLGVKPKMIWIISQNSDIVGERFSRAWVDGITGENESIPMGELGHGFRSGTSLVKDVTSTSFKIPASTWPSKEIYVMENDPGIFELNHSPDGVFRIGMRQRHFGLTNAMPVGYAQNGTANPIYTDTLLLCGRAKYNGGAIDIALSRVSLHYFDGGSISGSVDLPLALYESNTVSLMASEDSEVIHVFGKSVEGTYKLMTFYTTGGVFTADPVVLTTSGHTSRAATRFVANNKWYIAADINGVTELLTIPTTGDSKVPVITGKQFPSQCGSVVPVVIGGTTYLVCTPLSNAINHYDSIAPTVQVFIWDPILEQPTLFQVIPNATAHNIAVNVVNGVTKYYMSGAWGLKGYRSIVAEFDAVNGFVGIKTASPNNTLAVNFRPNDPTTAVVLYVGDTNAGDDVFANDASVNLDGTLTITTLNGRGSNSPSNKEYIAIVFKDEAISIDVINSEIAGYALSDDNVEPMFYGSPAATTSASSIIIPRTGNNTFTDQWGRTLTTTASVGIGSCRAPYVYIVDPLTSNQYPLAGAYRPAMSPAKPATVDGMLLVSDNATESQISLSTSFVGGTPIIMALANSTNIHVVYQNTSISPLDSGGYLEVMLPQGSNGATLRVIKKQLNDYARNGAAINMASADQIIAISIQNGFLLLSIDQTSITTQLVHAVNDLPVLGATSTIQYVIPSNSPGATGVNIDVVRAEAMVTDGNAVVALHCGNPMSIGGGKITPLLHIDLSTAATTLLNDSIAENTGCRSHYIKTGTTTFTKLVSGTDGVGPTLDWIDVDVAAKTATRTPANLDLAYIHNPVLLPVGDEYILIYSGVLGVAEETPTSGYLYKVDYALKTLTKINVKFPWVGIGGCHLRVDGNFAYIGTSHNEKCGAGNVVARLNTTDDTIVFTYPQKQFKHSSARFIVSTQDDKLGQMSFGMGKRARTWSSAGSGEVTLTNTMLLSDSDYDNATEIIPSTIGITNGLIVSLNADSSITGAYRDRQGGTDAMVGSNMTFFRDVDVVNPLVDVISEKNKDIWTGDDSATFLWSSMPIAIETAFELTIYETDTKIIFQDSYGTAIPLTVIVAWDGVSTAQLYFSDGMTFDGSYPLVATIVDAGAAQSKCITLGFLVTGGGSLCVYHNKSLKLTETIETTYGMYEVSIIASGYPTNLPSGSSRRIICNFGSEPFVATNGALGGCRAHITARSIEVIDSKPLGRARLREWDVKTGVDVPIKTGQIHLKGGGPVIVDNHKFKEGDFAIVGGFSFARATAIQSTALKQMQARAPTTKLVNGEIVSGTGNTILKLPPLYTVLPILDSIASGQFVSEVIVGSDLKARFKNKFGKASMVDAAMVMAKYYSWYTKSAGPNTFLGQSSRSLTSLPNPWIEVTDEYITILGAPAGANLTPLVAGSRAIIVVMASIDMATSITDTSPNAKIYADPISLGGLKADASALSQYSGISNSGVSTLPNALCGRMDKYDPRIGSTAVDVIGYGVHRSVLTKNTGFVIIGE